LTKHRASVIILWGRTGLDLDPYVKLQAEDDGWPLKKTIENLNANDNVDMEKAPSVAEADEILAKFGYVEEEALQPVA
jgi:hypothetical protein